MKSKIVLLVLLLAATMTVFAQDAEPIDYGDMVTAELEVGERGNYTFTGSEGDPLSISLTSDDFDTILYLLDADGMELTRNDDGGGDLNSLILGYALPADGTYTIQAASFGDDAGGSYTLDFDLAAPITVEYGQVVEGTGETPEALYNFTGNMGDVIVVTVVAEGFDTYVEINNPEGNYLDNSDYIDGNRARLGPLELPMDGTYVMSARHEGEYTLEVERVEPIAVTLGEPTTAELTEAESTVYFQFDLETAQVVDIAVDSGNTLDTSLDLIDTFGFVASTATDSNDTVDPAISGTVLNTPGTYYLIVYPGNPNATLDGEITVLVDEAELASLEDAPLEMAFSFEVNEQVATFEGTAGTSYTLVLDVLESSEFVTPFVEITQGENILVSVTQRGTSRSAMTFTVPEDGTVNVSVEAYSDLTLEVILTEEEAE